MLLKARDIETDAAMDMTAMIDVVFNLLIFFLVAGSLQQTEREMQIALPHAASAGPISAALRELIINVDADGQIIVASRRIEPAELSVMIKDALARNPQQKVTVRGDRKAAYAHIVRVLDVCKAAGVQEPYLDTVLSPDS